MYEQPQPSPLAGFDLPESQTFVEDLQRWVRACQDGTVFCLRGLIQGIRSILDTISSLFKLSGKEGPPHSEF